MILRTDLCTFNSWKTRIPWHYSNINRKKIIVSIVEWFESKLWLLISTILTAGGIFGYSFMRGWFVLYLLYLFYRYTFMNCNISSFWRTREFHLNSSSLNKIQFQFYKSQKKKKKRKKILNQTLGVSRREFSGVLFDRH